MRALVRFANKYALLGLNALRRLGLRLKGARLGRGIRLDPHLSIRLGVFHGSVATLEIGDRCHLEHGVVIHCYGGKVVLSPEVHVGPYSVLYGHGGISIGAETLIAPHCRLMAGNHAIPPPDQSIRTEKDIPLPIAIGRDVWLGTGVTVLGGVTIGDGCVVGAGSVVTRDLPAYSVAWGVPAKVHRSRNDTEP